MKRILRAVVLVGLSSVAVVLLGAVRHKLIAVGVGADGIGTLGILTSIVNLGVVIFSLGLNTSGIQAIAAAVDDPSLFPRVRAALLRGSGWLGAVGVATVIAGGLLWGLVSGGEGPGLLIILALGLTVGAMVVSGAQLAMLNGIGRMRALAICNSLGAAIGTGATALCLGVSDDIALVAALAAAPVATAACTSWFVYRSREPQKARVGFRLWRSEFRGMATLGGMVMVGLLVTNGAQLVVRLWIESRHGLAAAGHFQASWTITTLYVGFVLTALAAEYFPRISGEASQTRSLNRSVDMQIRIALLLAGPVLLIMIVLAPIVLNVLYSPEFLSAVPLLRWQLVGDVMKIVGWAIAFLLLARKARLSFLIGELCFNAVYLIGVFLLPSTSALEGVGIAYMLAYTVYVGVLVLLAYKESRFRMSGGSWLITGGLFATAFGVRAAAQEGSPLGIALAASLTAGVTIGALLLLLQARRREKQEAEAHIAAEEVVDRARPEGTEKAT
ncbi:oligosaccharide flippase family protein [Microbacterium oxydans]|uniref:oligosaccharide flippase family protein n=1 Tax=Microbacterium oxydans TaxID=82380 RepID=UPI0037C6D834